MPLSSVGSKNLQRMMKKLQLQKLWPVTTSYLSFGFSVFSTTNNSVVSYAASYKKPDKLQLWCDILGVSKKQKNKKQNTTTTTTNNNNNNNNNNNKQTN